MDAIAGFDAELFRLINNSLTSPFLDILMPYVTEKFNFLGVIIAAAVLIIVLGKRQDRIGLLLLVALVLLSDLAANTLKGVLARTRPCNAMDGVRLLVGCGSSFSMPSGHATNIFAAMVFLSTRYKRFMPAFLVFAFMVAYSRVYVGVHYPLDALVGALLGTAMALGLAAIEKGMLRKKLLGVLEAFREKRSSL